MWKSDDLFCHFSPTNCFEFQNLTEYNTAHNRRISMLGITDDVKMKKNKNSKRKRRNVTFNDEECIINPEDVDPNVGRFRNLIQTTVVPTKRSRVENNFMGYTTTSSNATASAGQCYLIDLFCFNFLFECRCFDQWVRFGFVFFFPKTSNLLNRVNEWVNLCMNFFHLYRCIEAYDANIIYAASLSRSSTDW